MNILLISVVFPYPIDAGGSVGTHKMIDYLRANHTLTLVCPESTFENEKALTSLWPDVKIVVFSMPKMPSNKISIKKIIKGFGGSSKISKEEGFKKSMALQTTDLVNFYFENLIEIVRNLTKENSYDLIQVEFIDIAPIVHFLPIRIPKVFVHHEIRHKRMLLEFNTLASIEIAMMVASLGLFQSRSEYILLSLAICKRLSSSACDFISCGKIRCCTNLMFCVSFCICIIVSER